MNIKTRIQHAWNAFTGQSFTERSSWEYGAGSSGPSHRRARGFNGSDFSAAIFNRIALDAAMTTIHHVKIDAKTEDRKPVDSGLNYCLNTEANIDQTNLQFVQDIVYSMFDEGSVAIVPVDTTVSPKITGSYEVNSMRVGKVTQWYPKHVKVKLYNETTGNDEEVTLPKSFVAIIENPMYAVMNGPNATLKRLLIKMQQLDNIDEIIASGKLNMLIQLPFAIKSDLQRKNAEERVSNLEAQLANNNNKHGIGYIDATEKIHQIGRPLDNKIIDDIAMLTHQFYNQLGLTENVFNGTASEAEMRGYYTRTIDPVIDNIIAEFNRKFFTKTARTQGHTLEAYRDPFNLVTLDQIANMGDTFRRNSILTGNEIRMKVGFRPHNDPRADELYNPNMPDTKQPGRPNEPQKQDNNIGSLTPPAKAEKPAPK